MNKEEKRKEALKVIVVKLMEAVVKDRELLQSTIEELYELEKGPQGHIDIGWKRKGRELGFIL